jgi:hypothetical protein
MLNQNLVNELIACSDIHISQSVYSSLADMALQLQLHYAISSGVTYDVHDLQVVLIHYLEGSIEALVDDLMFHVVEGDRAYAFNRSEYERQINKLQPLEPARQIAA